MALYEREVGPKPEKVCHFFRAHGFERIQRNIVYVEKHSPQLYSRVTIQHTTLPGILMVLNLYSAPLKSTLNL